MTAPTCLSPHYPSQPLLALFSNSIYWVLNVNWPKSEAPRIINLMDAAEYIINLMNAENWLTNQNMEQAE